nr:MAG: RNA-dependent RNA polymerase [Sanya narna-like virus 1]
MTANRLRYNTSCPEIGEILRFSVYYRVGESPPTVPTALRDYVTGVQYLSMKQVPSCLMIRKPGSFSIKKQQDILRDLGFQLSRDPREYSEFRPPQRGDLDSDEEEGDVLLKLYTSSSSDPSDPLSEEDLEEYEDVFKRPLHINYSDPWKIISARSYMDEQGLKPSEIRVWFADVLRLQDPLPARILGPDWKGSKRNKIRFQAIADPKIKIFLLCNHTHWGKALVSMAHSPDKKSAEWAKLQIKRLKAFFSGKPDPRWTSSFKAQVYDDVITGDRLKTRATRFIETLKTVDGMFCQRYISFPQEVWTWQKYDMYILRNLFELISDEFLDGELKPICLEITTRYEELKQVRGTFKKLAHSGVEASTMLEDKGLPPWLHQFQPLWYEVMSIKDPYQRNARIGLLSQTRGCGTPPPLVVLKTKAKFIEVVSSKPTPLTQEEKRIVWGTSQSVVSKIPDFAFTGLSTKGRITVTNAACWEYTQKEGGTVQAISDIVALGVNGQPTSIFDLETGQYTGSKTFKELHPGEYIFWRCLEYVLGKPRSDTSKVQLVAIKEPGKSRIVTKGSAYVKVILDVVNKLCSEPLKKGLESSSSGMGKSHHGWNFFKSFFEKDKGDFVFDLDEVQEEHDSHIDNKFLRKNIYKAVFVSSTDYETATDYMHLEVASIIGNQWMIRCGIPRVLRALVHQFCFVPREVYFHASGALATLGQTSEQNVRKVTLQRGIMMGDPLTKVILHLLNVCVREFSQEFDKVELWRKIYPKDYLVLRESVQAILKENAKNT